MFGAMSAKNRRLDELNPYCIEAVPVVVGVVVGGGICLAWRLAIF
jgi:hypothetical protein